MITTTNTDYYSKIPSGRDLDKLPKGSSSDTTIGYQDTAWTEEDRFAKKVLKEHYDKVHKENIAHSNPTAYIESKYCNVTSPNFCFYMTEDQRRLACTTELKMLEMDGKYIPAGARFDYALRNYKGIYTGGSAYIGYSCNIEKEKQYARSVVNQQILNLFFNNGISINKQMDLKFSIDPYTYQLTVSGNTDNDTLSMIQKLLNEGDNAKNLWLHTWFSMHNGDNEIVNKQANDIKANQYSLWHEFYKETGYDVRKASYQNGKFIMDDGTDLLKLYKEKAENSIAYELYSERLLNYAKNGWNEKNDLVLEIGFDSNGLYDIGQEKGYGLTQSAWIDNQNANIFDARI